MTQPFKRTLCAAVVLAALLSSAACSSKQTAEAKSSDKKDAQSGDKQDKKEEKSTSSQRVLLDGAAQQRAGIEVAAVASRQQAQTLTAPGRITVNEERTAHIGVYSEGRIAQVLANVGDVVRPGQVLARMHSHDVHEAMAAFDRARSEVARRRGLVEYAQRMRDRYSRLLELKSASVQEVERAESELRGAEADLHNAETDVEKERVHITDVLQIPLPDNNGKLDEAQEMVPIKAAIGGTVIARQVTPGAVAQMGIDAFTTSDLSSVWMLAAVNEKDLSRVKIGMPVKVYSDAYPGVDFRGRITRLGTQLDPATRTLPVRVLLPNPAGRLRPEMYVTAEIAEGATRAGIYVPEESLQDLNGNTVVFVRRDGREFTPRAVEVAHRTAGEAEIAAGLKAGEQIAVKGAFVLKSQLLKSTLGEE